MNWEAKRMSDNASYRVSDSNLPHPVAIDLHELSNLVSIIIAEAQLLQAEFGPQTLTHTSALAIERAARRLQALIGLTSGNGAAPRGQVATHRESEPRSQASR